MTEGAVPSRQETHPVREGRREAPGESQWRIAWRTLRRNPMAMVGLVGILLLALVSLMAPWLAPHDPTRLGYDHPLEPPNKLHPFGTDDLGRDVFSRVLWGGRESLRVGFMGLAIGMVGGLVIGMITGYAGGWVDLAIMRIMDIMLAFPAVLLMLSIVAALGPNLGTVLIALGISSIPTYSRLIRGSVIAVKSFEYVIAAQVIGATHLRIMLRHILPNIIPTIIVFSSLGLGGAIMITAGLSYIGLGAQPPSPEWGAMLNYGRKYMHSAWWMSVFPGLAIFVAVLCVNLLGDGLRDALDPRLRS
jgi:peptide/nickel transport system permease protein